MTPFEHKLRGQLQALAAAGHSKLSAAEELCVAPQTLRNWLERVDPDREIAWTDHRQARRRPKPAERPPKPLSPVECRLRDEIEALAAVGHSRQAVADEFGIHPRTLSRWLKRLDPNGAIPWPVQGRSRRQQAHQARIAGGEVNIGRPRKARPDGRALTPSEQRLLEQVGRLARTGCSKLDAAKELGVHRATLDRWLTWLDPNRALPWPPKGRSRAAQRHSLRIRLRVVPVGGRPKRSL